MYNMSRHTLLLYITENKLKIIVILSNNMQKLNVIKDSCYEGIFRNLLVFLEDFLHIPYFEFPSFEEA